MTKPWEETWWATLAEEIDTEDGVKLKLWDVANEKNELVADMIGEPHACLVSAAPDMARVLLEIEWLYRERSDRHRCPSCDGDEPDGDCPRYGHRDGCALDAALRKAGVR